MGAKPPMGAMTRKTTVGCCHQALARFTLYRDLKTYPHVCNQKVIRFRLGTLFYSSLVIYTTGRPTVTVTLLHQLVHVMPSRFVHAMPPAVLQPTCPLPSASPTSTRRDTSLCKASSLISDEETSESDCAGITRERERERETTQKEGRTGHILNFEQAVVHTETNYFIGQQPKTFLTIFDLLSQFLSVVDLKMDPDDCTALTASPASPPEFNFPRWRSSRGHRGSDQHRDEVLIFM